MTMGTSQMLTCMEEQYGNPSSLYSIGQEVPDTGSLRQTFARVNRIVIIKIIIFVYFY